MNTTIQQGDTIADGKYIVEHELGEGGLAVVYKVRHATLDTPFAVKILKVTLPSLQSRLITEGQLQAQLQHPNVVKVTDVITVDGFPALVMEFIDGIALDDYLNEQAPTSDEAIDLFLQILDAVEEAHDRGIIHRDLKPANVMMQKTRSKMIPKVCDFGLGKNLAKEGQTRTGQQMGTPAYMAPEQIRSTKDVDQRADIFSLGAILYELLTGHRAFRAANTLDLLNAVATQPHPTPRLYIQDLDDRYVQAIDGALTKNAQFRIPDCATLRRVLLGEEEWRVERPSARTGEMADSDTLMNLGLDLVTGDISPDTAVQMMNEIDQDDPKLSSLVSERRVHHAPGSPNSTVVQQNPNAQANTAISANEPPIEATETKKSPMGMIAAVVIVLALVGGFLMMNNETPTTSDATTESVAKTQPGTPTPAPTVTNEIEKEDIKNAKVDDTQPSTAQKSTSKPSQPKPSPASKTSSTTKKISGKATKTATTADKSTSVAKPVTAKPTVTKTPTEQPPAPKEEPASSGPTGTVSFKSAKGLDKGYIVDASGKKYTSSAPEGSYTVHLVCNGKDLKAGSVKITAGKTSSLQCDCMFTKCK